VWPVGTDEGKHRGARRLLCRTEGKREGEGERGADTARGHRARRGGSDMDARLRRDRAAGGGQFRQRQTTVGQKFRGCSNPSRPRRRCRRPRSHQWPTRPRRPRRRATGTWRTPLTRPPTTRHPPEEGLQEKRGAGGRVCAGSPLFPPRRRWPPSWLSSSSLGGSDAEPVPRSWYVGGAVRLHVVREHVP
jgi:hypothetical protein